MVREWDALFDLVDSGDQTTVHFTQVTALLHGNYTQVIFLVAPDQECFVVIVIDTASSWPETAVIKEEVLNGRSYLLLRTGNDGLTKRWRPARSDRLP